MWKSGPFVARSKSQALMVFCAFGLPISPWTRRLERGYVGAMIDAELRGFLERIEGRIERLETTTRVGFERTDARFAQVDVRMDRFEARLDQLSRLIEHLRDMTAEHFELLESRINERFERLEQRT